jgi:hypothetical protein
VKTQSLEILEKSKLPAEQARAIFKAMELELTERDDALVKKGELHALELRVEQYRAEVKEMGTKLVLWMFGMFLASTTLLFAALSRNWR